MKQTTTTDKTIVRKVIDQYVSIETGLVRDPRISPGAKILYIALKASCSPEEEGTAFPDITKLVAWLGVGEDVVNCYIKELTSRKLLSAVFTLHDWKENK